MTRAVLILALLAVSTMAHSDGIGFNTVGQIEGIGFSGTPAAGPAAPCSGTGLKFNIACNSQYIGTL